jgi:hypothetical protein
VSYYVFQNGYNQNILRELRKMRRKKGIGENGK